MSEAESMGRTRLTLDLWHPRCWAIEATDRTAGGILAHAVYGSPGVGGAVDRTNGDSTSKRGIHADDDGVPSTVTGLFTAFGDDEEEVETLLDAVAESPHGGNPLELQERFGRARNAPGSVVREFFLEYDPADMICPTLLEQGFVHSAPVRIEDGSEEWQVLFTGDRNEIEPALDRVMQRSGAEVEVTAITSTSGNGGSAREHRLDTLTPTQRKVFEHAREEGYYQWPRGTSTRDLAADLDISKTTLLEHLRKAEAKLLDP
ncbi:helix-turn-helix domain-containing protein [Halorubrum vacuolatum]|uniref:HTH bat-type domain-containing protein n=1 Tax=Halorubrum vacuolatum TaxID=63740 RepID=A0A238VFI6_HALVU|nr:helix-turn-helix domain-containing protein [Halorubrum vacuolatum]SNR32279.1 hypothetical protein SAMN06264855_102292 [Halorubrum vacuolatum]